jgi:hypothetical protein
MVETVMFKKRKDNLTSKDREREKTKKDTKNVNTNRKRKKETKKVIFKKRKDNIWHLKVRFHNLNFLNLLLQP